jgi:hypothetical protein
VTNIPPVLPVKIQVKNTSKNLEISTLMQAVLHGELTARFPVGKLNKQNVTVGTTELLLNALGGQEAASKERFYHTSNNTLFFTTFFLLSLHKL